MSDAVSTTNPDGTITVTLPVNVSSKDWLTAADAIRVAYPGRFVQWYIDTEGRDAFEVAAPVEVAPLPCGLCAAGQPHGHGGAGYLGFHYQAGERS